MMIEYKTKQKLTKETVSFFNSFDIQTYEYIKEMLRDNDYATLNVKYGSAIVDADGASLPFELKSNASLSLQMSNKFAGAFTSYLSSRRKELDACLKKGTQLLVELTFVPKEMKKQAKNVDGMEFVPTIPKYSFEQVILPDDVRKDIFEAINILKYQELIYNVWGFEEIDPIPRSVINFYGPPGTGKTMSAHAVAKELNKRLLALNYAQIESKYVGDAVKNLSKAFETAKSNDCILFFDEADSFLGKRINNVTHGAEQALNSLRSQMLILLEEFPGIIIFATNLVSNFDQAFESRILKHIKFSLPNEEARIQIIQKTIPPRLPLACAFTDAELTELSQMLDGLSGREIKGAIQECLLSKAFAEGSNAIFRFDDFLLAFERKREALKKLASEKPGDKKAAIFKAMQEGKVSFQNPDDGDKNKDSSGDNAEQESSQEDESL